MALGSMLEDLKIIFTVVYGDHPTKHEKCVQIQIGRKKRHRHRRLNYQLAGKEVPPPLIQLKRWPTG